MSQPVNLGRFISIISIIRLPPLRDAIQAGESVLMNADLTLLRGDGNIFVWTEVWRALLFRTDPDRKQAAA